MKYAVEMGSGAMVYIQHFTKIGSGTQVSIHRDSMENAQTYFYFFKIRDVKDKVVPLRN
jgi:hypothetical protein